MFVLSADGKREAEQMLKLKYNNFMMEVAQWFRVLIAHLVRPLLIVKGYKAYWSGAVAPEARLFAKVIRANGDVEDLGLISTKLVTTAFVEFLVDNLVAEVSSFGDFKFHGMGTGSTAEAIGDTTLVTAVETRDTGTQLEGASANIYRSVGTVTATSARAVREHGLFNIVTGGILMDRSVFALINLATDDAIQFTYELTVPAGG